ncbi:YitT family protein [Thermoactinomyces sp. CICC 10521]|uniref:YczE/YyaS/YitT family protein n=1 Tax=Thermoactinomyces sp. CICC 10521 TaxID=2767426 RepID=UPI0018DB183B|nr:YitT family protein [Thermoactinomyces sp. CICC 10521]MBH8607805.1 YitT family protein [Thermoactinomyces sp. CICC 10521]
MRLIAYLSGLVIKSFGISLMIRSHLGTGSWDGFYVGMSNRFGLTVGSWLIVIGIFLILLNSFLTSSKPDFFSLITVFILGFCIDFWLGLLNHWGVNPDNPVQQVLVFWAGLLFTTFGMSTYVQARFALTPVDQFMYALHQRFGFSLMVSKTIGEVIALAFAIVLEGPVGLGTVIFTFLCGPLIQFFIPMIERLMFG